LAAAQSGRKSLGYLLATSSTGSAYVYLIEDLFEKGRNESIGAFEAKFEVVLRVDATLYGQCTCADWSQVDGATRIATGHSNGSIILFDLSDTFSYKINANEMVVMPLEAIHAQVTYVKTLKWHRTNSDILASASSFNREIK
jgi:WD40 repeat protein